MKFITLLVLVAACIAQSLSAVVQGQLSENLQGPYNNLDQLRVRKAAKSYGPAPPAGPGPSFPPCPTNYMISCGPQLQPVACSSGGGGGAGAVGFQGAYSENVPQYTAPQYYAPQYITPQQYAFPPYAVPVITEV